MKSVGHRGRCFCRLYDREKRIGTLGSRCMFLKAEERFSNVPEETIFSPFEMRQD